MAVYSPTNSPEQNLSLLAENPYPGRLLIVGFAGEVSIQAYAVEGRSEGSRNRVLTKEEGIVGTEIADTSLPVGDPELTIYDAMRTVGDLHIVSNGNQTDRVVRYLRSGKTFAEAMEATDYEPDAPNFTPRVSGFHHFDPDEGQPSFGLSVISKDPHSEDSIRRLYTDQSPELQPTLDADAIGYCVHTYEGDGNPLPSFDQPPFTVPVEASAEAMAGMLWEHLDRENRVAVVAKAISLSGAVNFAIINRHL